MNEIEREILESDNPRLNYEYAKNFKCDVTEHSKIVALSKDLELNYLFARDIEGADVSFNALIIMSSKDPYYNYIFARDVKGADIKEHAKIVIDSMDPKINFLFMRDIVGCKLKDHYNVIFSSGNEYYIREAQEFITAKKEINASIVARKHH